MMNFLRYKATYFGNDKVARDITLDDLNEEDMKWMLSGLFHIQDGRDQSGRVIIYLSNTLLGKCKADTLIRVAYYIWFNILIPIPEVQMKGLVGVYFDASKPGENIAIPGFNSFLTIMSFTCSLPMRYSAAHLCVKGEDKGNLALNNAILGFAMNAYPQSTRLLVEYHDEYDVAPRFKRRKIVTDLRELLNSRGIRFLQQRGSNEWEEVDTKAAELKIAQLFRSIRKKKGPISS
ncbi:unnamed protein product [Cylindrotheca closterium]|uniref:DUF6824 domain-containing protein n=1 Tax=Cylindrotheca closterium TaxID=2856 RepID=A0AAD2FH18_9STRA|nr:unnamed protein product [Cylindrotheca closterium]